MNREERIEARIEDRARKYRMTDEQRSIMRQQLELSIPEERELPSAPSMVMVPADSAAALAHTYGFGVAARKTPEELMAIRVNGVWMSVDPEMARRAQEAEDLTRERQAAFDARYPATHAGMALLRTIAAPTSE